MWNISVSGRKDEIGEKIDQKIEEYATVDYCDGQLQTIKDFVLAVVDKFDDSTVVSVTSAGGDMQNLPARMAHTINITVH